MKRENKQLEKLVQHLALTENFLDDDYPVDKYLFGRVLHNALECLNNFSAASDILLTDADLHGNTRDWFLRNKAQAYRVREKLLGLGSYYQENEQNWLDLVEQIGMCLEDISQVNILTNDPTFSISENFKQIVQIAINNLRSLNILYDSIKNHDYIALWYAEHKNLV